MCLMPRMGMFPPRTMLLYVLDECTQYAVSKLYSLLTQCIHQKKGILSSMINARKSYTYRPTKEKKFSVSLK